MPPSSLRIFSAFPISLFSCRASGQDLQLKAATKLFPTGRCPVWSDPREGMSATPNRDSGYYAGTCWNTLHALNVTQSCKVNCCSTFLWSVMRCHVYAFRPAAEVPSRFGIHWTPRRMAPTCNGSISVSVRSFSAEHTEVFTGSVSQAHHQSPCAMKACFVEAMEHRLIYILMFPILTHRIR